MFPTAPRRCWQGPSGMCIYCRRRARQRSRPRRGTGREARRVFRRARGSACVHARPRPAPGATHRYGRPSCPTAPRSQRPLPRGTRPGGSAATVSSFTTCGCVDQVILAMARVRVQRDIGDHSELGKTRLEAADDVGTGRRDSIASTASSTCREEASHDQEQRHERPVPGTALPRRTAGPAICARPGSDGASSRRPGPIQHEHRIDEIVGGEARVSRIIRLEKSSRRIRRIDVAGTNRRRQNSSRSFAGTGAGMCAECQQTPAVRPTASGSGIHGCTLWRNGDRVELGQRVASHRQTVNVSRFLPAGARIRRLHGADRGRFGDHSRFGSFLCQAGCRADPAIDDGLRFDDASRLVAENGITVTMP